MWPCESRVYVCVCTINSDLLALPAEEEEEEGTVLVFYVSAVHVCC